MRGKFTLVETGERDQRNGLAKEEARCSGAGYGWTDGELEIDGGFRVRHQHAESGQISAVAGRGGRPG